MMARPSRPSVRFTALLVPTITAQNGTIKSARVGNAIVKPLPTQALKSGHSSVLAGADTANARRPCGNRRASRSSRSRTSPAAPPTRSGWSSPPTARC
ncbi:hypothetical protein G6F57_022479 [Rhizopus arrhizus]|nr:hypothetical protein G6F57_022479 [Rhizopus arrhizus]